MNRLPYPAGERPTEYRERDEFMEFREVLQIVQKYSVSIIAWTLAGVIVAAIATMATKPTFESETTLYVTVDSSEAAVGDLVQGAELARQSVATYATIATTQSVLEPVIKRLGLNDTTADLAKDVTANAPVDQTIVEIKVTRHSAKEAASIANEVGNQLSKLVAADRESSAEKAPKVSLTTVQPALESQKAVSPSMPLNLIVGLLLGLLAGFAQAAIRRSQDTRLSTVQEIAAITDAPVLAAIPTTNRNEPQTLLDPEHMQSVRSESFRVLRTNLEHFARTTANNQRGKSFVVTSPNDGDGKSTISINLALILAQGGSRVLLIDGNLRTPALATKLGLSSRIGLSEVLTRSAQLEDAVQPLMGGALQVLPAGRVPANPSELLGSSAMSTLLSDLAEQCDYIIVDSPALLAYTDAAVLATQMSASLMVTSSGSTPAAELAAAVRALLVAGVNALGVVVNKTRNQILETVRSDASDLHDTRDRPARSGRSS